jgi:hypothetical protein
VLIDSPPSYRASRFLVALLLVAVFLAAIAGLLLADLDTWLIDGAKQYIAEVRAAW